MKQFVIADIHGNLNILNKAIETVESKEASGEIIFTGDYVDRGPDSKGVLDRLMAGPPEGWKWTIIRGNHEDMMLEAKNNKHAYEMWFFNGGDKSLQSFKDGQVSDKYYKWIKNLPRYIYDDFRIFTHAAISDKAPINHQHPDVTQWMRFNSNDDYPIHNRYIVHGHTPQKIPFVGKHRCNLDTNSWFNNIMYIGEFDKDLAGGPIAVHMITVWKGLETPLTERKVGEQ
jgi:serine/threonine protein phosphatase 1